jgi:hypothetical protein
VIQEAVGTHVLVALTDPDLRDDVVQSLLRAGFAVEIATGPYDARLVLEAGPVPRVALVDRTTADVLAPWESRVSVILDHAYATRRPLALHSIADESRLLRLVSVCFDAHELVDDDVVTREAKSAG